MSKKKFTNQKLNDDSIIELTKQEHDIEQLQQIHIKKENPFKVTKKPGDSKRLYRRLLATDFISALFSFLAATDIISLFRDRTHITRQEILLGTIAFVAATLILSSAFKLYRTRIVFVPSDERLRVLVVALIAGGIGSLIDSVASGHVSFIFATCIAVFYFVLNAMLRAMFRNWLKVQRAQGRFHREVILIGTNSDAVAMYKLLRTHRDVGYSIVGVIGDRNEARSFEGVPWLGELSSTFEAVKQARASGVIVAAGTLKPYQLRKLANALLMESLHVHVSAGLYGFDDRRLRQQNFSREPVFYIEPITMPIFQRALKRTFDIITAFIGLVFAAPIIAIAAIAIKLEDRGPVFFRQDRVGKNQTTFKCIKLRTMSVDAELKLDEIADQNERSGPLYKNSADPRRTKVGKFLEATSIDELPQLWLALKGVMSIVGPRPAMPHEVELFDEELNLRHYVRPGITGLWQVESRDNASFEAYRRLDIFYVENWSFMLDLSILSSTFFVVLARAIKTISAFKRPGWMRAGVEIPGGTNAR